MNKYTLIIASLMIFVSTHARVIEINSEHQFNNDIAHGISVVKFYSPNCPHCQSARRPFEQASNEMSEVNFISVNTEDFKILADKYHISGLPTFLYFKDGSQLKGREHRGNNGGLKETIAETVKQIETSSRIGIKK